MSTAAGSEGRDPNPEEAERPVLFLSADLPFATPQEISEFIRRGAALDCDYAVGLVTEKTRKLQRNDDTADATHEPGDYWIGNQANVLAHLKDAEQDLQYASKHYGREYQRKIA